jgi:hypothetical protein
MGQVSDLSQEIQVLYELRNIQTLLMGIAGAIQSLSGGRRRKLSLIFIHRIKIRGVLSGRISLHRRIQCCCDSRSTCERPAAAFE